MSSSFALITTLLLVLISALSGSIIAYFLKLPLMLGYIVSGVAIGTVLHGFIDPHFLTMIGDMGVVLLLFTLGVEFSFHRLRKVFHSVVWLSVGQMLLTITLFFPLLLFLGQSAVAALFLSVAFAFSSTAIVIRLLSEKGELETVPGEIATGWLVVQDIAVIPAMIVLFALAAVMQGTGDVAGSVFIIGTSLAKAFAFVAAVVVLGKYVVPWLLSRVARIGSREVFLIAVVSIVFLAATGAYALGLSAALGAFIAGLFVAQTSQNHAVFAEIRPLRDLFAVVFFVTLGMALPIASLASNIPFILLLSISVIGIKWLITYGISRAGGLHRKTAFFVAVALSQVSEFGFLLTQEGVRRGFLGETTMTLVVSVTCLTILCSAPLIAQIHQCYYWFFRTFGRVFPKIFPVTELSSTLKEELPIANHIVICGYGRVGKYIGRALEMTGVPYVVVDYNHTTITKLKEKNIPYVYGDPADKDVLDYAQVDLAQGIVIAIPDRHTQELIIGHAHTLNKKIRIICRTHHEEDQARLKALGVHMIVQPEFEASVAIVEKLLSDLGITSEDIVSKVNRLKVEHGLG